MSIGMEVWELVEEGYDVPKITPTEAEDMNKYWEHAKSLNTLQVGEKRFLQINIVYCKKKNFR